MGVFIGLLCVSVFYCFRGETGKYIGSCYTIYFVCCLYDAVDAGGGRKLLCILAVITVIGSGVWTFLQEDEYLQQRIEDTMEGNSSGRDTIYREALECWYYAGETQFWIGHGFLSTIPEIGKMAHNDWLEILVDYGVLGFVIYALLFYQLIKVIKRESDARYRMVMLSCLSIWILKSLYSMAYLETLWCVLLAPLGMVIGCRNRKTNVI